MPNTQIEFFASYSFQKKEFEQIPSLQRAAVSVSAFASSECNTIMRCYSSLSHRIIDVREIDAINLLQRHVLLRVWSSKLFEFHRFLAELRGEAKKSTDNELNAVLKDAFKEYNKLKKLKSYDFVRDMRNSSANHYSIKHVLENFEFISSQADLTMNFHNLEGNSLSPTGEEVLFIASLNRFSGSKKKSLQGANVYDEWFKWNISALSWLRVCHVDFWRRFAFSKFPEKYARRKPYWLPPEFVGDVGKPTTPLFLRKRSD